MHAYRIVSPGGARALRIGNLNGTHTRPHPSAHRWFAITHSRALWIDRLWHLGPATSDGPCRYLHDSRKNAALGQMGQMGGMPPSAEWQLSALTGLGSSLGRVSRVQTP